MATPLVLATRQFSLSSEAGGLVRPPTQLRIGWQAVAVMVVWVQAVARLELA